MWGRTSQTFKERESYGSHQQDRAPGTCRICTRQRVQREQGRQLLTGDRHSLQDQGGSRCFRDDLAQHCSVGEQGHARRRKHQQRHAGACRGKTQDNKIHQCRRSGEDFLRGDGTETENTRRYAGPVLDDIMECA